MPRHWKITPPWSGCREAAQRMGISPLVTQLLHSRGISDAEDVRTFLHPELKGLYGPEELPGATQAAEIIARKIKDRKRIVIYGDYDVDGITATSILWHLLRLAGGDVSFYIPHRLEEGYGLNGDALKYLHRDGTDTVITVDCGITSVAEAVLARELGLTLIVTDHHAPGPTIPDADAIVHPRVNGDYPNPDLCGAGVAFKLAWALAKTLSQAERVQPEFRQFLLDAMGLVALGTVADVVPLTGENRILTRFGLMGLPDSTLPGIVAMIDSLCSDDRKIDSEKVGFWMAPRLNAAGRMGHAQLAVELLTRADEQRAREILLYLEDQNRSRQTLERKIFKQACEKIEKYHLASDARRAIVLASDQWHPGVIGIVASRVVERYTRPTILIALKEGEGQGSGRSVRHFELHQALSDCAEHLISFGGHAMAAGLKIESGKVDAFADAFVECANHLLTGKDLDPALRLDAEVGLSEMTEPVVRELHRLAPFGMGNPKPKFASAMLELDGEPRTVGKSGDHLQIRFTDGRTRRKAIAFRSKEMLQPLLDHRRCRVAFEPVLNTFNGRTSVELSVIDFAFPD